MFRGWDQGRRNTKPSMWVCAKWSFHSHFVMWVKIERPGFITSDSGKTGKNKAQTKRDGKT